MQASRLKAVDDFAVMFGDSEVANKVKGVGRFAALPGDIAFVLNEYIDESFTGDWWKCDAQFLVFKWLIASDIVLGKSLLASGYNSFVFCLDDEYSIAAMNSEEACYLKAVLFVRLDG